MERLLGNDMLGLHPAFPLTNSDPDFERVPHALRDPARLVMDHVPAMLAYWDRDLVCRFANRAHARWFDLDADRLVGSRLHELLGADLHARTEPYVAGVLQGQPQRFQGVLGRRDGVRSHSLVHFLPHVVDGEVQGFMAMACELAEMKDGSSRAPVAPADRGPPPPARGERRQRDVQRLGRIGSWEWEVGSDIVTWSEQLFRLFGQDPGRPPPGFLAHERFYSWESWVRLRGAMERAVAEAEPFALELQYRGPDGRPGWIESRGEPVRDADAIVTGLRGTVREIDAPGAGDRGERDAALLSQALRELALERQKNAALEQALTHAKKLEELGLLASSVAHDFNNVLASVGGAFHVLERTATDAMSKDFIVRGRRGVERGARLVHQLQAFALKAPAPRTLVALADLLDGCRELLPVATGPRVRVRWETASANARLRVQPESFETALLHLAANAREAMPDGGTLTVRVVDRPADAASRFAHVDVAVHDDGAGMPPDVLARAREPFFTTREARGASGLGLAMVGAFARDVGGALVVTSEPGLGTTATLRLPLDETDAADGAPPHLAGDADRPGAAGGGRAEAVVARIRDGGLRELALAWLHARGDRGLPSVESLERTAAAPMQQAFVVEVVSPMPFAFRRVRFGAPIGSPAGDVLDRADAPPDTDSALGDLEAAWRQGVRRREPAYEDRQLRLDDGATVLYERLLLPCIDGQGLANRLVGMVAFDAFEGTGERGAT